MIFLFVSISNIMEFGNYTEQMEKPEESFEISYFDDNYVTSRETINMTRNKLTKKSNDTTEKNEQLIDYVEYTDEASVLDIIPSDDADISLVPIYETMLFSGVPAPETKPVPEEIRYEKSVILSVKNKKVLKENLLKFLNKSEAKNIYSQISDKINLKAQENLKFYFNSDDEITEVSTYIDGLRQLNLRRNTNKNFVYFYVKAPTETKVIEID